MMLSLRRLTFLIPLLVHLGLAMNDSAQAEMHEQVAWPQLVSVPAPVFDFRTATAYPVLKVVDADHLVVLINNVETTVRFAGVDIPKMNHLLPAETDAFRTATHQYIDDLLQGESVYLEEQQILEKETLAYVFRAPDGLFVDSELIRQGFGYAPTADDHRLTELFHYCQQRAYESQKGIWTYPPPVDQVASQQSLEPKKKNMVFVTSSGAKYHLDGCPLPQGQTIPIALYKAVTGFAWCDHCKPPR